MAGLMKVTQTYMAGLMRATQTYMAGLMRGTETYIAGLMRATQTYMAGLMRGTETYMAGSARATETYMAVFSGMCKTFGYVSETHIFAVFKQEERVYTFGCLSETHIPCCLPARRMCLYFGVSVRDTYTLLFSSKKNMSVLLKDPFSMKELKDALKKVKTRKALVQMESQEKC